jgi:hypothetical protein
LKGFGDNVWRASPGVGFAVSAVAVVAKEEDEGDEDEGAEDGGEGGCVDFR